jgi:RNA polymerase sigma factor (sigma-70 family)
MMTMRTRRKLDRRVVLSADLDRLDAAQSLWGQEAEGSADRDALRDAVREAVATALTDKQREVVEACFFEGLSQGEIARRLGIAQQVVQKRLYGAPRGGRVVGGAMARLREALSARVAVP